MFSRDSTKTQLVLEKTRNIRKSMLLDIGFSPFPARCDSTIRNDNQSTTFRKREYCRSHFALIAITYKHSFRLDRNYWPIVAFLRFMRRTNDRYAKLSVSSLPESRAYVCLSHDRKLPPQSCAIRARFYLLGV